MTVFRKGVVYLHLLDKEKDMFAELVQGFNEAWLLLKNQLKSHGKCFLLTGSLSPINGFCSIIFGFSFTCVAVALKALKFVANLKLIMSHV